MRANAAPGLYPGQYYMIKNAQSGLYITMSDANGTNGSVCTMQERSADITQHFSFSLYNGSYMIHPRTSQTSGKLTYSDCNVNGSSIQLQSSPLSNQLWTITRGTYGYRFSAKDSANGLSLNMNSYNTNVGASVKLWYYGLGISDWILEPAYQGNARYFVHTELDDDDSAHANSAISRLRSIGYSTMRIDYPNTTQIASNIVSSRCAVFHGHGEEGRIRLDDEQGNRTWLFSEKPNSGNQSFKTLFNEGTWGRLDYVMFINCYSAAPEESLYRRSVIDVAYDDLGVSCVTGFRGNVAGGEVYLNYMMQYMTFSPTAVTLEEAFAYADRYMHNGSVPPDNSPANLDNRVTIGFVNKTIEMI